MAQQGSALVRQGDGRVAVLETNRIIQIAGREGRVERFEGDVLLPPSFMYVIPGRKKVGGEWVDDNKVGITSDGYDYANRTLGASFFLPARVPDEQGALVRNPIHRNDYIYMRMAAVWYNEAGQLVMATEDLEVDYQRVYANARLESQGARIVTENGQPVLDARGDPVVVIEDWQKMWDGKPSGQPVTAADQEKKAYKALMQLRTMGMRYAQTVLRTRLLKIALGVKSLPLSEPKYFTLKIVGYRDDLDPIARARAAAEAGAALFGAARPDDGSERLSDAEMRDVEADDVDTSLDRKVGAAVTGMAQDEDDDGPEPFDPTTVPGVKRGVGDIPGERRAAEPVEDPFDFGNPTD